MSMEQPRRKADGGERPERLSETVEQLEDTGELGHKGGQEFLQDAVMSVSELVVERSPLDWDDVSRILRLLSDAAENKAAGDDE